MTTHSLPLELCCSLCCSDTVFPPSLCPLLFAPLVQYLLGALSCCYHCLPLLGWLHPLPWLQRPSKCWWHAHLYLAVLLKYFSDLFHLSLHCYCLNPGLLISCLNYCKSILVKHMLCLVLGSRLQCSLASLPWTTYLFWVCLYKQSVKYSAWHIVLNKWSLDDDDDDATTLCLPSCHIHSHPPPRGSEKELDKM